MDFTEAVDLSKQNKEEGFNFLYQSTYQKSYYIACKYMKQEDAAQDVLQDAYIKAFRSLEQLQDAEKFASWFARIVAGTALDALKKRQVLLFSQIDDSLDTSTEDTDGADGVFAASLPDDRVDTQPELSYDRAETARLVQEIIDALSDEQRFCILMYYTQELSVKEIADTLQVSENTVKSRLNYGRKKIKEQVLDLEKRGTKLYAALPIAFFLALLTADVQNAQAAEIPSAMFNRIRHEIGKQGVKTGSSTTGRRNAGGLAAETGKAAAWLSMQKLVIGIAAVLLVGTGAAVVYQSVTGSRKVENQQPQPVMEQEVQTEDRQKTVTFETETEQAVTGAIPEEKESEDQSDLSIQDRACLAYQEFLERQSGQDGFCVIQLKSQVMPMLIYAKDAFAEEGFSSEQERKLYGVMCEFYYFDSSDASGKMLNPVHFSDIAEDDIFPVELTYDATNQLLVTDYVGSILNLSGYDYTDTDHTLLPVMTYSDMPLPKDGESNGDAAEHAMSYQNSETNIMGTKHYNVVDGSVIEQSGEEIPSYEEIKGEPVMIYQNSEELREQYLGNGTKSGQHE